MRAIFWGHCYEIDRWSCCLWWASFKCLTANRNAEKQRNAYVKTNRNEQNDDRSIDRWNDCGRYVVNRVYRSFPMKTNVWNSRFVNVRSRVQERVMCRVCARWKIEEGSVCIESDVRDWSRDCLCIDLLRKCAREFIHGREINRIRFVISFNS